MAVRDWRLTGANPLAYMGVNAGSPPNIKEYDRAPKTTDNKGYIIGDFWLDTNASPQNLWILVSLALGVATWIELGLGADSFPTDAGTAVPVGGVLNVIGGTGTLTSGAGNTVTVYADGDVATTYNADIGNAKATVNILNVLGGTGVTTTGAAATLTIDSSGDVATSYVTDVGTATPALNVLNVLGGDNINTAGATDTATVHLNEVIRWPNTNAGGTTGIIYLGAAGGVGGDRFISNLIGNTFIGVNSGNFTMTGTANTGCGRRTLQDVTNGFNNTAVGHDALTDCITGHRCVAFGNGALFRFTGGERNTALGTAALDHLATGSYNIGIGERAGESFVGAESSNIAIGHAGGGGTSNTIHLGSHGAGARQQNKCVIAGIRGITTASADAIPVLIDSGFQLGTVSSSIRYKQNVEDMDTESDDLLKLRPVTFEYKKHPGIRQYGLIAEEVEEVMPRLVVKDEDGFPETVKYHVMQSILLHAIQKLVARVDELEKKILA